MGAGSTAVIDAGTGRTRSTIPVGGAFMRSISHTAAFSPDGRRGYVVDQAGTLHVLDIARAVEVGSVKVGTSAGGIAVSPDGRRGYVATLSTVAVVNLAGPSGSPTAGPTAASPATTASPTVVGGVEVGNAPISVALAADGSELYVSWYEVATTGAGALLVVNPATRTVTTRIPVGAYARDVVVAGTRVLVAGRADLAVVEPAAATTRTVAGVVPLGIAASTDGTRAYAPVAGGVAVINTATATVLSTLPVTDPTGAVVATPDGRILVGTALGVSILDPRGD